MSGRRPLLSLALAFAAGVALAPAPPPAIALAGAGTLLAVSPALSPLAFGCAGLIAGSLGFRAPISGPAFEAPVEGRIVSVPDRLDDRARFAVREGDRLLEVTAPEPPLPLAAGDRVRLAARLRAPAGPRNPGGPDRSARLGARGIEAEGFGWEPPIRTAPPSPLAFLEAARDRFGRRISALLPAREAALIRALGAGDASAVDPATLDAFARTGLAHLLSVSGLHLAVVAAGFYRLLRYVLERCEPLAVRLSPRRVSAAVALPVAALYALATGAQVPVVRSAIGAGIVFLGVLLEREGDTVNTLCLAGLAILAVEPGALLDPSFQLSFVSVAGLALLTSPFRGALPLPPPRSQRLPARAVEAIAAALCASAAATIATAPIVVFHFRRLSLAAIPANAAGVPLGAALTVLSALAALASSAAPPLVVPLCWLARPVATLLLAVNDLFAAAPWGSIGIASPGAAGVLACYALGALAWIARGKLRALLVIAAAITLAAPGPLRDWAARRRGVLEVIFVAVGQGDGAILRLPDGSTALVDAGGEAKGRYDPGARDVVPLLRDLGVRRIAAAFVSHPHPDHLLGLPAVAAAMPVERVFSSGRRGDDAAQAAFARLPHAFPLREGDGFVLGGARFEVLAPAPDPDGLLSENDASLVLRVSYGETSFLFAGDLESEGEAAALARGPGRLRADVVKVPHHGSRMSSTAPFVAAVGPRFAVYSVGRDNRFGFPDAGVVARWEAVGALTLRTDEGAVRLLSDGRAISRTPTSRAVDLVALLRERI